MPVGTLASLIVAAIYDRSGMTDRVRLRARAGAAPAAATLEWDAGANAYRVVGADLWVTPAAVRGAGFFNQTGGTDT